MTTKKKAPKPRKPKVDASHFAIGLPVLVREGATPYGWPDGERWVGAGFWDREDYLRTWTIQGVSEEPSQDDRCSYEVAGWYWLPEDLTVAWR